MPDATRRKILVYEPRMMMMRNAFTTGAEGVLHSHPHVQSSYVVSGRFEITIDGRTEMMEPGDSFLVSSAVLHRAKCLEAGEIIEIFTPMRQDFLS
ncbi:MAG: cupin domain-containing protein [Pseudaminobacter sp.]|nr:cupin domain-containing protein [Pseudaminobacter sp.]